MALVMKAMPKAFMNNEMTNSRKRLNLYVCIMFGIFFESQAKFMLFSVRCNVGS